MDGEAKYKFLVAHTDVTFGPGPVNFTLTGEDLTGKGNAGKGKLEGCAAKFVPFPVE